MITEYEWRTRTAIRRRPAWVGAQCIYPSRLKKMAQKYLYRFAILLSVVFSLWMPIMFQKTENYADIEVPPVQGFQVRQVGDVTYAKPDHLIYETVVFTYEQLQRGKMLLLDESHPLPEGVLPPNTASIAKYGNGMVPIHSLNIKSGRETIDALKALFSMLKSKGYEGIYVYQGTTTASEQYQRLIKDMRMHMKNHIPEKARAKVLNQAEMPGMGEMMREHTVELRLIPNGSGKPDEKSLEASRTGQALLQYAWRYGFVRSDPKWPYRFRYVGKAHATAMTYLDLNLADYLEWLHQKGVIAISSGGQLQYIILCQPINEERTAFEIPEGAQYEASYDNTGYAIVACTL